MSKAIASQIGFNAERTWSVWREGAWALSVERAGEANPSFAVGVLIGALVPRQRDDIITGLAMPETGSYSEDLLSRAAKIKLLLMDCDGVLTNGKVYFLPDGKGGLFETKGFDSEDGIALQWAHTTDIQTGIISGRSSPAVEQRARSVHMKYLYQGDTRKLPLLEEIMADSGLSAEEIAYIGDDVTDLPILKRAGLAAAPANSRLAGHEAVHFVTASPGGAGAVRDVIELLLKAQNRWPEIMAKYDI